MYNAYPTQSSLSITAVFAGVEAVIKENPEQGGTDVDPKVSGINVQNNKIRL